MRTLLVLCLLILQPLPARSDAKMQLRVGPVSDKRFGLIRDVNTEYDVSYLATRYKTAAAWQTRAAELRQQVLASAGLVPMPEKTPLNAHIFGKVEGEDYTIEKVYFESYPGFYCTGNLYRPKPPSTGSGRPSTGSGREVYPAILNPHGHWQHGRIENSELGSIPGRCINFAKQGYISFAYDMIGYNDSNQVKMPLKEPGVLEKHDAFGERRNRLWAISLAGLQLWNSIRAVDFLESLPDVDRNRIACTGASGGGTQTFLLTAVDDRVKMSAPVNMISTYMAGGCRCENLPNLRIDTDNVEIGAMGAPRPLLMVSATGDWTKNTPDVEFPAVRSIYRLVGAEDKVSYVRFDAPHNYNQDSREAVYAFLGKYLHQHDGPVKEQAFTVPSNENLLVFPDRKLPEGALDADGLVKQIVQGSDAQLEAHRPKDSAGLDRFHKLYEPALRHALSIPATIKCEAESRGKDGGATKLVLRDSACGAEIPALLFEPSKREVGTVLLVSDKGKRDSSALADDLSSRGWRVLAIDAFNTGEHVAPKDSPVRDYDLNFFDTYNRTDTAERVYDILLALNYLQSQISNPKSQIGLVGSGKAGLWCLLARPFSPKLDKLVVDAAGVDVSSDEALLGDLYVPCLRRAGDFRAAVTLAAPGELFIHNTQRKFDTSWAESAYKAANRPGALELSDKLAADAEIAKWLCKVD